jgi:hypothetical protein
VSATLRTASLGVRDRTAPSPAAARRELDAFASRFVSTCAMRTPSALT